MNNSLVRLTFMSAVALSCGYSACADTLPYLATVDAVETDGTQYFDTGLPTKNDMKIEIDCQWVSLSNGDLGLCSSSDGSTAKINMQLYDKHFSFAYSSDVIKPAQDVCPPAGVRHLITGVFAKGGQEFYTNGVLIASAQSAKTFNDTTRTLVLGAYRTASEVKYHSAIRIYGARFWTKEAGESTWQIARDYRPVAVNNNGAYIGALYDEANGSLVNSTGTNPARAVMEPVKVSEEPEILNWVESDGRQFIDTGIKKATSVSFSVDYAWKAFDTNGKTENSFFAATASSDDGFYALHEVNKPNGDSGNPAGGHFWCKWRAGGQYVVDASSKRLVALPYERKTVNGDFRKNRQTLTVDGVTYAHPSPSGWDSLDYPYTPAYIFARDIKGTGASGFSSVRFYSMTIDVNDQPVRSYKPCLDKNGRVGLYDSLNQTISYSPVAFSAYGKKNDQPAWYVEYVETDGRQFLDTGVIGKSGTKCELDFEWTAANTETLLGVRVVGDAVNTQFSPYCGQYSDGYKRCYYGYGTTSYWPQYWATGEAWNNKPTLLAKNERHRCIVELDNGCQTVDINGKCYYKPEGGSVTLLDGEGWRNINAWQHEEQISIDTQNTLYLFAEHLVTDTAAVQSSTANGKANARLYSAKIWQKDAQGVYQLVRDYRPVELTTGEIVLFDKVEKKYDSSVFYSAHGGRTRECNLGLILVVR